MLTKRNALNVIYTDITLIHLLYSVIYLSDVIFLEEIDSNEILENTSRLVKHSKHVQTFLSNSLRLVEHFYFWNDVDSTKVERNIDLPKCFKNAVFQRKSQIQNFRRNLYARRIFYTVPKFFSEVKTYFWTFSFFESCSFEQNWQKYRRIIPPPQNRQKGGVWHTKPFRFRVCLQTKKNELITYSRKHSSKVKLTRFHD